MNDRTRLAILLLALSALLAPAAAALGGCDEDGGDLCCAAGCVLCMCCAHQPSLVGNAASAVIGLVMDSPGPPAVLAPATPHPRDILHVPIAAPSR